MADSVLRETFRRLGRHPAWPAERDLGDGYQLGTMATLPSGEASHQMAALTSFLGSLPSSRAVEAWITSSVAYSRLTSLVLTTRW